MKKIKISMIALVAILMGIAGSAFTNEEPVVAKTFDATYYYVGNNTLAQMQEPNNWLNVGTACDQSGNIPCTIDWVGSRSVFDSHVQNFSSIGEVKGECATLKP